MSDKSVLFVLKTKQLIIVYSPNPFRYWLTETKVQNSGMALSK